MKLPTAPPAYGELFDRADSRAIISRKLGPEVKGNCEHWDRFAT